MRSVPVAVAILLLAPAGAGCIGSSGDGYGIGGASGPLEDGNQAPTSFFTYECHHLDCAFDGARSEDGDGELVAHRWNFGDGETGQGPLVDHSYDRAGTYTVTLTVRDDNGGEDTSQREVTVEAAPEGHSHGSSDDDADEDSSLPDDYRARYDGPITPDFSGNWSVPVNATEASRISVHFNVTSETFPTGLATNVTVNLTDPDGDEVLNATVDARDPEAWLNVTEGAGQVGSWTVHAAGHGLGDEDLEATKYVLEVAVEYGG